MNPVIFTFGSVWDHPGFVRFRASAERNGWAIDPHTGEWPGERQMWQMFFDRLPHYKHNGYTHALRLDAFDTLCLGHASELERAWELSGNPAVLVSAEAACWPSNYPRAAEYEPRGSYFWFAHSPCTVDLRQPTPARFFDMPDHYAGDQTHFANLILDREPGIAIDRPGHVVQSLAHVNPWTDAFELDGGRVVNKLTGSRPLMVHANGMGTTPEWVPG